MSPGVDAMYCPVCGNLLGVEGCLVCGYVDFDDEDEFIDDEEDDYIEELT